jgi:hypothetical protein
LVLERTLGVIVVIFFDIGRPVNAITQRLATPEEDGEGPEHLVGAKYLVPVVDRANVIVGFVGFPLLVKVFDCGFVREHQLHVELEEECHEGAYHAHEEERDLDCQIADQDFFVVLVQGEVVGVNKPLEGLNEIIGHGEENEVGCDEDIDEEEHEILSIPESHAVVNPGTMMVHVQNTPIAGRTVMASLRLEHIAH